MAIASFAAGCFWGVEAKFRQLDGVLDAVVGYAGGDAPDPTYQQVCAGATGHAETVQLTFNPDIISYQELCRFFFEIHDASQLDRQGPDIGAQYRSAIFYHDEAQRQIAEEVIAELSQSQTIVTQLSPFKNFYKAEEYHQRYHEKHQ